MSEPDRTCLLCGDLLPSDAHPDQHICEDCWDAVEEEDDDDEEDETA